MEYSGPWALSAAPSLSVLAGNQLSRIVNRNLHPQDLAEPCTNAHTHALCASDPGASPEHRAQRAWRFDFACVACKAVQRWWGAKVLECFAARYARPRAPFTIDLSTVAVVAPPRALPGFLIKVAAVFTSSSSLSTPSQPLPLSPLSSCPSLLHPLCISRHICTSGQSHYYTTPITPPHIQHDYLSHPRRRVWQL
jgi:hypothetical protein